jgi:hypothetical protein
MDRAVKDKEFLQCIESINKANLDISKENIRIKKEKILALLLTQLAAYFEVKLNIPEYLQKFFYEKIKEEKEGKNNGQ